MKQRKLRDVKLVIERAETRYQLDPHRRARIIPNNKHKIYNRKGRDGGSSDAF